MKKRRRVTACAVTGSDRHVSKTHGSHNGRKHSFPHLSDSLERAARLPDLTPSPVRDKKRGRRHRRATWPQVRIVKAFYQDPMPEMAPGLQRFHAFIKTVNHHNSEIVSKSIVVIANTEEEVIKIALEHIDRHYILAPCHPPTISVSPA